MDKKNETPVFIKIDEYKDIVDIMKLIRNKIEEGKKTLSKIDELKKREDSEVSMWQGNLQEIEKKVKNIDNLLFEPEDI